MKKYFLFLFLLAGYSSFATVWHVRNLGFTFTPASLTITQGDTIIFDIDDEHNVQQVSLDTWHHNGTTPLPGGFSLPLGGGMILTDDLEEGTYFYVCQPHVSMDMKGLIQVLGLGETTSTSEDRASSAMQVYPNPSNGLVHLAVTENAAIDRGLVVFDIAGNKVNGNLSIAGSQGQLDLTQAAKGIYFIRFRHEGEMYTRKIVTH